MTVERLKSVIRGMNSLPTVTNKFGHMKISGTKDCLITSIVDILKVLKAEQNDDYFRVAKLIGQAQ